MITRILTIETSEDICSVAVFENQQCMIDMSDNTVKNHSQLLTVLINKALEKANLDISLIDAVAISRGPGSYTGLRIGTSVAKGLCYALRKPLLAVNTLEVLCYAALDDPDFMRHRSGQPWLCPMIDARRMEVYMQIFDDQIKPVSAIEAKIVGSETFSDMLRTQKMIFFGSGSEKIAFLYHSPNAVFIKNIRPLARYMIETALAAYHSGIFEDVAYFEPYYLKDFVATRSTNKVLRRR